MPEWRGTPRLLAGLIIVATVWTCWDYLTGDGFWVVAAFVAGFLTWSLCSVLRARVDYAKYREAVEAVWGARER